jgi:hypothetical protein
MNAFYIAAYVASFCFTLWYGIRSWLADFGKLTIGNVILVLVAASVPGAGLVVWVMDRKFWSRQVWP